MKDDALFLPRTAPFNPMLGLRCDVAVLRTQGSEFHTAYVTKEEKEREAEKKDAAAEEKA